jgi:hypothetical protein
MRTLASCFALAATAVLAVPAHAALPVPRVELDRGSYVIYSHDQVLGREEFTLGSTNDTLVLHSETTVALDPLTPDDKLVKTMEFIATTPGWKMVVYGGQVTARGKTVKVTAVPGTDTTVSVYHEQGVGGVGDVYTRPRGLPLLVLDPMLYSLFQVAVAELPPGDVDRQVAVLTLASRDTVVEARVHSTGTEMLAWGGRPVTTRTLRFEQGGLGFDLWVDPKGRLLRISHAPSGLHVERQAPPIKPRKNQPKPKPGR